MPSSLPTMLLERSEIRAGFWDWILSNLSLRFPSSRKMRFTETLWLKGKGLTRAALAVEAKKHASLMPMTSYYRLLKISITGSQEELVSAMEKPESLHFHWIDNFKRSCVVLDFLSHG